MLPSVKLPKQKRKQISQRFILWTSTSLCASHRQATLWTGAEHGVFSWFVEDVLDVQPFTMSMAGNFTQRYSSYVLAPVGVLRREGSGCSLASGESARLANTVMKGSKGRCGEIFPSGNSYRSTGPVEDCLGGRTPIIL